MQILNIDISEQGVQIVTSSRLKTRQPQPKETILLGHKDWERMVIVSKQFEQDTPVLMGLDLVRVDYYSDGWPLTSITQWSFAIIESVLENSKIILK